jgi:hypothetical protein
MKTLSIVLTAIVIFSAAALGWTRAMASSWWGSDHDDYYYDRPWYGGPWYGRYGPYGYGWGGPYGWGGGPYGWGGGPYGWGGGGPYGWGTPRVIHIYTEPQAPSSQDNNIITVH